MKTNFKQITPELAKILLQKNTMNRLLKTSIILEYSRLMLAGLWKENTGEAIKIAYDGTILDGQHRLEALIKANVTLSFLFVEDMDKDIFPVLDSGAKRTPGDVLRIAGINNPRNLAGGIRGYYYLKIGRVLRANTTKISSSEVLSLYQKRPKFWDSATFMSQEWYAKSKRILTMGEFISLYTFFYDISNDDAFSFISNLAEGANLSRTDPIFQLREKLIFFKINPKFTIPAAMRMAYIVKAWNSYRKKEPIKILRFNPENEKYPIAI